MRTRCHCGASRFKTVKKGKLYQCRECGQMFEKVVPLGSAVETEAEKGGLLRMAQGYAEGSSSGD